jgi:capsid protein
MASMNLRQTFPPPLFGTPPATTANVIAVANGFKSRQGIISEAGGDIEDVLDEIAADNQLAESKGVELNADRASEPEAE